MSMVCKTAIPIGSVLGGGWPQPALIPEGRPPSDIVIKTLPPSPPAAAPLAPGLAPVLVPAVTPLVTPVPLPLLVPAVPPTLPLSAPVGVVPATPPEVAPDPPVPPAVPALAPVELLGLPVLALAPLTLAPVEPRFSFGVVPPLQPTASAPRTPNKANGRKRMEGILPQPCCSPFRTSTRRRRIEPGGCMNPAQLHGAPAPSRSTPKGRFDKAF